VIAADAAINAITLASPTDIPNDAQAFQRVSPDGVEGRGRNSSSVASRRAVLSTSTSQPHSASSISRQGLTRRRNARRRQHSVDPTQGGSDRH
jgi:hypothetical protein